jgi:uncharacterized protein involved in exopolysaccharide biosynthesis
MPLAGLVLNRVQAVVDPEFTTEQAAAGAQTLTELAAEGPAGDDQDAQLTAALLTLHAQRMSLAARQRHLADRFTAAHPGVPVSSVPALAEDVHDLAGLRMIGDLLADSL